MNANLLKGYVFVLVSGVLILAGVVLVILQWGNAANFSLYGKNIPNANTGLIMLCSAVGGIMLLILAKMMLGGALALRRGRIEADKEKAARRAETHTRPVPPEK